jgi:hypothetical protein
MTVAELIEKLQGLPQYLTVIVPSCSDYSDDIDVGIIEAFDHNGYIEPLYRHYQRTPGPEVKQFVLIT